MRKCAHSPRTLHSGRYILWIINKSKHNYDHCSLFINDEVHGSNLWLSYLALWLKLRYYEKATEFEKKISHLYWHLFSKVKKESLKSKVFDRILHNLNLAQLTRILRHPIFCVKVQIFWERHKILKKSPHFFDIT